MILCTISHQFISFFFLNFGLHSRTVNACSYVLLSFCKLSMQNPDVWFEACDDAVSIKLGFTVIQTTKSNCFKTLFFPYFHIIKNKIANVKSGDSFFFALIVLPIQNHILHVLVKSFLHSVHWAITTNLLFFAIKNSFVQIYFCELTIFRNFHVWVICSNYFCLNYIITVLGNLFNFKFS